MSIEEFQNKVDGSINDFQDGIMDGRQFRAAIMDTLIEVATPQLAKTQLIAAAPDLLEALKALVDAYESFVWDAHEDEEFQNALAAIKKATTQP